MERKKITEDWMMKTGVKVTKNVLELAKDELKKCVQINDLDKSALVFSKMVCTAFSTGVLTALFAADNGGDFDQLRNSDIFKRALEHITELTGLEEFVKPRETKPEPEPEEGPAEITIKSIPAKLKYQSRHDLAIALEALRRVSESHKNEEAVRLAIRIAHALLWSIGDTDPDNSFSRFVAKCKKRFEASGIKLDEQDDDK